MASIDSIINMQQNTINSATDRAATLANRINNWIPITSVGEVAFQYDLTKPAMTKPMGLADFLPTDDRVGDLQFLNGESEKWIAKYFPQLTGCLNSTPEEWICKILSGDDPYGDSQQIFDAVWHQARDQVYRERSSLTAQIRADFSSRGFTIPPGAMIGALMRAEEGASDAIGQANRDEMKRATEIKLDLLKFAAEQAIQLKVGIMRLLADFYGQWVRMPDRGVELAKAKAQVYASFQAALSDYHKVELGFEELSLKASQTKADVGLGNDRNKTALNVRNEAAPANAQAARAFADIAAAAATGQSAMIADLTSGS